MSTDQQTAFGERIEQLVDAVHEAAVSWLTMNHAWQKIALSAVQGYSPSTEAANVLARAARGAHAEQD